MEKFNSFDVIKYGTEVLTRTREDGRTATDYNVLDSHGDVLNRHKERAVIVSSGAKKVGQHQVGSGLDYIEDEGIRNRIFATLGNPELSRQWQQFIPDKIIAQALITNKTDKAEAERILRELYREPAKAILQVNGNDFESPGEMHRDNDENAANMARWCLDLAERVRLVFCTESGGFYEGFGTDGAVLIPELSLDDLTDSYLREHCNGSTNGGTGNMRSKIEKLVNVIREGVGEAFIIGKKSSDLEAILRGDLAGTRIIESHNIGML